MPVEDIREMSLSHIVGHSSLLEQIMRSVQAGRIVHALLFIGPRGTGKRTAARAIAQAVFCTSEHKPCGSCPACKRFLSGTHPDIHVLASKGKSIGVDDVRALMGDLALKPYEGGMHIAIIEQADKMTPSAQNALLKTLESPVGESAFMLLTDTPSAILPTIHSRCQAVRFSALTPQQCTQALLQHDIEPERAKLLAELSQGSVGRALEINADKSYFLVRERVLNSIGLLRGPASVAQAAQILADDKENSQTVLEILELFARDLMAVQNGQAPFKTSERDRLMKIAIRGSALLMGVLEIRRMLASNVQWISALEDMYLKLTS